MSAGPATVHELFHEHNDWLVAYCQTIAGEMGEEVAARVWLTVVAAQPELTDSPRGWLARAAWLRAKESWRKRRREARANERWVALHRDDDAPTMLVHRRGLVAVPVADTLRSPGRAYRDHLNAQSRAWRARQKQAA